MPILTTTSGKNIFCLESVRHPGRLWLSPVSQRPILYMCLPEHDPILYLPQSHLEACLLMSYLEACLLIPIAHSTPTTVCLESLALIFLIFLFWQRLDMSYRNSLRAFIYSLSSKLPTFHPLSPMPNKNNNNKFSKYKKSPRPTQFSPAK